MNITKQLVRVFVLPQHNGMQNVIRRVHWIITFEQDGYSSVAFAETFLDVDNIQNFIAADQVGTNRLLDWAYEAQGGDAYVAQIQPYHLDQIQYQKNCSDQEEYSNGFDLLPPVVPTNIPSQVL